MKKLLTSLVLGLALSATGCGVFHAHAPVPGAVNSFDSDTYLGLATAKGVIDQTKADLASNAFPASIADKVKSAVNDAVKTYNVADVTYQAYHNAAVQGTSTPAQQAAVTTAVNNLNTSIKAVTAAKAGN
jgi:hypothetical protein